jgi:DNA (cytosine-5)-methyltransferase 1
VNVLDLFSGIGGFSLGLERAGMRTVAFCERDEWCRRVLAKHWPHVPQYDDVRTIPRIGGVDLVAGGFPCQPWSHAGKQLGAQDDRHLWPAMLEVIKRERPAWVLGENVAGIVRLGIDAVLSDLEDNGYACRAFVIPAVAVDDFSARETANRRKQWASNKGMTLLDYVRLFPTPDASPHKYRLQGNSQQSKSLNGLAGGKLNPEFSEWLMGFPLGWTALDASAMPSSRKSSK